MSKPINQAERTALRIINTTGGDRGRNRYGQLNCLGHAQRRIVNAVWCARIAALPDSQPYWLNKDATYWRDAFHNVWHDLHVYGW